MLPSMSAASNTLAAVSSSGGLEDAHLIILTERPLHLFDSNSHRLHLGGPIGDPLSRLLGSLDALISEFHQTDVCRRHFLCSQRQFLIWTRSGSTCSSVDCQRNMMLLQESKHQTQSNHVCFHELIEFGGTFSVNILCLPDKQSGLLPRMTMTKNVWLCVPVKSWLRFRSGRE